MSLTNTELGLHSILNSFNPAATAHQGVTQADLINLSASISGGIIRIPVDLSTVSNSGFPQWQLDIFNEVITAAELNGLKIIFEPGQTPIDLSQNGSVSGEPIPALIDSLADRFAIGVQQIYQVFAGRTGVIQSWEVGNEPNLSYEYIQSGFVQADFVNDRFYSVSTQNAQYYAEYLNAVANKVAVVEANLGVNIDVIGAGIAHNDYDYMDTMFATLANLNASNIDGFAVHPYTTYADDFYLPGGQPDSGRPTDWIPNPDNGNSESWDYYYSFQGALYNFQYLADYHGFGDSDIWVTEFGVPSYLGDRNAGPDGEIDQARWYAEAFGVFDSWGNDNLKGIMAHSVLDNNTVFENGQYNAYDGNNFNDGSGAIAEGSFGLFGSYGAGINNAYEKAAAGVFRAVANGDFYNQHRIYITANQTAQSDVLDFSTFGTTGFGLTSGYIVLSRDGDDQITGSAHDDSIFGGAGVDIVYGNLGNDRIYGGSGNDTLYGETGNDEIYGNSGDDVIHGGSDANKIDGGTGFDRVVLLGTQAQYSINGDGQYVFISGSGETVEAINVEVIEFSDGSEFYLGNVDVNRGNGGVTEPSTVPDPNPTPDQPATTNTIYGTVGDDNLYGTAANDLIIGDDGVDVINGSLGDDTIIGGVGNEYDQVDYTGAGSTSSNFTFTDNGDGSVTVVSSQFGQDLLWGIEGIWFGEENQWYSMDDLINPPTGPGPQPATTNTIYGTVGNDNLYGTAANDLIIADEGQDVINGSTGDDTIIGGISNEYDQVDYTGAGSTSSNFSFTDNGDGSITVVSSQFGQDQLWGIDGIWFGEENQWYAMEDLVA